jgi:hypothetical protein
MSARRSGSAEDLPGVPRLLVPTAPAHGRRRPAELGMVAELTMEAPNCKPGVDPGVNDYAVLSFLRAEERDQLIRRRYRIGETATS